MYKLLRKIGNVLFHRLGIVAVLIIAQLVLYFVLLALLREVSPLVGVILVALSAFLVLWIVGSKSNPGYKIGWIRRACAPTGWMRAATASLSATAPRTLPPWPPCF